MALGPITSKEIQDYIDKVDLATTPEAASAAALEGLPLIAHILFQIRMLAARQGTGSPWAGEGE